MVFGYDEESSCSDNEENKIYEKSTLLSGPMDSAWPMQGHDRRHTGRSQYSTANNTGVEIWRFKADGFILGGSSIGSDGTIYFGTVRDSLYALYPNGTLKWKYETNGDITSTPAIGDDGAVYVGSYYGNFYALYPNGTLKWQVGVGDVIRGSPTIADDGTIYIEADGEMFALYPNNGTKKWEVSVGMTHLSPSLGEDGTLYFGTSNYRFYAVNPDGTIKWKYELGHSALWESSAAISADGTIYFGTHVNYPSSDAGDIIALNPDGTQKWRKRIANLWIDSSPCIGEDGTVYIGSVNRDQGGGASYGYLHAFNDGVPNHAPSAPVITGPSIVIMGKDYEYTFVSTDPDDEEIYYYVNWEASTSTSGWYGPFESGYVLTLNHSFGRGTSNIRAKARDPFGEDSDLTIMEVVMPKNKIINPFERFLENHPRMFPLLRQLLGL